MDGPKAPQGWYPDPDDPQLERRWDGVGWTEDRRAAAGTGDTQETASPAPIAPAAGWYDDPEAPGGQRWWNGTGWTEARRGSGSETARPFYRKTWFIVTAALFMVMVIAVALTGDAPQSPVDGVVSAASTTTVSEEASTTVDSGAPTTTAASTATTTSEAPTTTEPETPATEATTTTTETPTTTQPAWESFAVEGQGDDVIDFTIPDDQPAVLELSHTGSANFALISYTTDGEQIDLLVNTIGPYEGSRPINLQADELVAELEITADGSWSITALPLAELPTMDEAFEGTGDQVILYEGSGDRLTATHDGEANFAVWTWNTTDRDLLVNEIGPYQGTVRIDSATVLIEVVADGNWTFTTG